MKRLLLIALPLFFVANIHAGSAGIEALGTAGCGASFDGANNATLMAFGGLNTYLTEQAPMQVLNRTVYKWINRDDKDEVQGIESWLLTKKPFFKNWYFALGGGFLVDFQNSEEQTDHGYLSFLFETGYKVYGIDFYAGAQVASVDGMKHKTVYAGIGLN